MRAAPGSSNLTPEQTDWFEKNYGERYIAVQADVTVASRKQRRARKRAQRRRGR